MTGTTKDSALYARVSQAHFENYKRKILAADNEHVLQGILNTIDVAVERQMIGSSDHESLRDAIDQRRRAKFA